MFNVPIDWNDLDLLGPLHNFGCLSNLCHLILRWTVDAIIEADTVVYIYIFFTIVYIYFCLYLMFICNCVH